MDENQTSNSEVTLVIAVILAFIVIIAGGIAFAISTMQ